MNKTNRIEVAVVAVAALMALVGCWKCGDAKESDSFVYASWNIGHFALGKDCLPRIAEAEAAKRSADYNAFLDAVGADVIGIAEYSEAFTSNSCRLAEQAVFGRYAQKVVGPWHCYQWNAQFWKDQRFISTKTVEYQKHDQDVYYVATRLKIAGEEVVFVATHLDWRTFRPGHEDDRRRQMQTLIDDFKDEPRVVISGDFNVGIRAAGKPSLDNPDEYKVFEAAGYTLGNDGRYKTCPAGMLDPERGRALDNIIVKGLEIADFRVFDRPDLSDHALVRARLTLKR